MNADGSNPVRLTNHPAHDFCPVWSPLLEEGEEEKLLIIIIG
jgi:hypothetical protein